MARFVVGRLLSMLLVLFAISVLTFLIFNVIPGGDPRRPARGQATPARSSWSASARSGASTRPSTCST